MTTETTLCQSTSLAQANSYLQSETGVKVPGHD